MSRARSLIAIVLALTVPAGLAGCIPPDPADGVLSGRIIASVGGPPLSGILVMGATESGVPIPGKEDHTDASGRFEIPGMASEDGLSAFVLGGPNGREDGYVAHLVPGPSQVMATWLEANNFTARDLGDIVLDPARPSDGVLKGRLLRSEFGGVVAGVVVQATKDTGELLPGMTAVTDSDGSFTITGLSDSDLGGAYVFGEPKGRENGYISGRPPIQFSQVEATFGATSRFRAIDLGDVLVDPGPS